MATNRAPVDNAAKDELRLYAENTSELYPQFTSIVRNVQRKIASGKYDAALAPRLWLYWVDAAAKRYAREFGGRWNEMFNAATRESLAHDLSIDVYRQIMRGEYGEVRGGGAYANPMVAEKKLFLYSVRVNGLFRDVWATDAQDAVAKVNPQGWYEVSKVLNVPPRIENPLSSGTKAGLVLGAVGAVALIGYAVFGGSSAKASSSASPAPSGGTSSGGTPLGPPLGNKSASGTWQPAVSLVQGKTYRASADLADALTSLGFTVYTDHDAVPSDWPSTDLDPKRWRIEGTWNGPTMALPANLPGDLRVFELNAPNALVKAQWVPATSLTQGQTYRASLDVKSDAASLGFTVWDQYDATPSDWPSSDSGPDRWRVQGVWSAATVPDLSGFANSLVAMGVPLAAAMKIAGDVRLYELV